MVAEVRAETPPTKFFGTEEGQRLHGPPGTDDTPSHRRRRRHRFVMSIERVAVLGAGSWGTTFAKVLADAGRTVRLWARRSSLARDINSLRATRTTCPGSTCRRCSPPPRISTSALGGVDAVVLAVPSQALRENLAVFRDSLPPRVPVVSLAKGVEIGTGLRMSEVIDGSARSTRPGSWC